MVVAAISPINYLLPPPLQHTLGSEQTEAFDPEVMGGGKREEGPWQGGLASPEAQPLSPLPSAPDCLRSKYLPSLSDSLNLTPTPTPGLGLIVPHSLGPGPRLPPAPAICSQLYINSEVLPPASQPVRPSPVRPWPFLLVPRPVVEP